MKTEPPFMMLGISTIALICWLCSYKHVLATSSPIVHIKNGTLEGTIMISRKGREIMAFRGIPYAQPPIGELRFQPPKPFDSWTGVRSAKEDANICTQRDMFTHQEEVVGEEDCLYLNVYTPKLPSKENGELSKKYPVIIFFHPGAFITGSGHSSSYGPKYLLDYDVILVTFNYRLGPLGFLSTEDIVSPGNQGLKDHVQMMRWVNENIAAFNGDPNLVTITGQSAGAASVHHHMISPLSRGLFHRGISTGGNALAPWAIGPPGLVKNNTNKLGKVLDCPTDKSSSLIDCLKKKSAVDITATDRAFQVFDYCPLSPFRPVIEPEHPGALIKEHPELSLKMGDVAEIPWMAGFNSHEGGIRVVGIYEDKDKKYKKILDENFMELAPITFLYEHTCSKELKDNITKSIREFYVGDKSFNESARFDLINIYTDKFFLVELDIAIRIHLETLDSPVFYYLFAYKGSTSLSRLFGNSERDYGIIHGDELQYLFPIAEATFSDTTWTTEDHRMIDTMTSLWVNFARTGNPTPDETSKVPVIWEPVRTSRLEYLNIAGSRLLHMADNLYPDRVNFWANLPYRKRIELNKGVNPSKEEL